ncbi:hypothetical protein J132_03200, partial [Termitomyces sp. J132]
FCVGCDFMNWCFFFDECTDIATPQEAQEAQEMVTIAMDVIRNPDKERPHGEFIIGEATRQFWKLSSKCASEEVFEDPLIRRLSNICVDLIILSNDICSYNVEQARGDADHNLVTILMHHENLDLNEAMKWIGDYASKIVREFLNDLDHVPSFGADRKLPAK